MSDVIIGVDLGGTHIRAARLNQSLAILKREETLTLAHQGLESTLERIKSQIRLVLPEDYTPVQGIGVSAPGPLNLADGIIVAPPNLAGWHDVPLRDILQDEFNIPVFVGNDANVAALAEGARGAARGYRHSIYITVSTGIGSGIIVDGRLLLGKEGLAAEFGHAVIMMEDGRVSTLEKEAAGPALVRKIRHRIEAGESSLITALVDGDLNRITGRIIGDAVRDGDKLAVSVVQRGGFIVGLGIVTLLHLFNPEIIVIGGGVSRNWDTLYPALQHAVQRYAIDEDYWKTLRIERPVLGDDVSIVGAAALVATKGGVEDLTEVVDTLN